MPRKIQDTVINGVTYRVQQLGATTGSQVFFRLGRAFASVIAGLRIGHISLETLSVEDFDWLVKTMQPTTKISVVDTVGGGKVQFVELAMLFDDHFAGDYYNMLQWLKFALEVNFGP